MSVPGAARSCAGLAGLSVSGHDSSSGVGREVCDRSGEAVVRALHATNEDLDTAPAVLGGHQSDHELTTLVHRIVRDRDRLVGPAQVVDSTSDVHRGRPNLDRQLLLQQIDQGFLNLLVDAAMRTLGPQSETLRGGGLHDPSSARCGSRYWTGWGVQHGRDERSTSHVVPLLAGHTCLSEVSPSAGLGNRQARAPILRHI